ncbi:MAG: NAD-dependent epimerase/dehydratase family protein [Candidatus Obscuribacterales bacterium]|nr:NAD-dependent epimerase/dehydratase family protein [Candidatus Obscuribacterales bacterium]
MFHSHFANKPILVTGGAGFLGGYLVARLEELGSTVVTLDRQKPAPENQNQLVQDSIEHAINLIALEDFQYIFHLAGNSSVPSSVENPLMDLNANIHSTFALLEAIKRASRKPKLVNVSSAAVYGQPEQLPIKENAQLMPISPYGVSKLTAERYVAAYTKCYGLQAASVRPFSIYGPGQRKQVVFDLLEKIRESPAQINLFGDGKQERDFIFVTDAIEALLLVAVHSPGGGECINVATGTATSIQEVFQTVCRIRGLHTRLITSKARIGDPDRWQADISKLKALGFESSVDIEEGLQRVCAWHSSLYAKRSAEKPV